MGNTLNGLVRQYIDTKLTNFIREYAVLVLLI